MDSTCDFHFKVSMYMKKVNQFILFSIFFSEELTICLVYFLWILLSIPTKTLSYSHLNKIIFHYEPESIYSQIQKKFEKIFGSFFKVFEKNVIWRTIYNNFVQVLKQSGKTLQFSGCGTRYFHCTNENTPSVTLITV